MDYHYKYLEKNLPNLLNSLNINGKWADSLITAHGDKCYGAQTMFKRSGLSFGQGAAIYILTHLHPYSEEVRQTKTGWVDPFEWIVNNKERFIEYLP